jgi:hypothetical protein
MPRRTRDVLNNCPGQHDVEPAEARDLLELALAVRRDDADPLPFHQLDVAVEGSAVARIPVAGGDVVAQPAKRQGKGPEPGTHLEHFSAIKASTAQQLHQQHHPHDVHAEAGAHRLLRQHGDMPLESVGSKPVKQLDQVLRGAEHDALEGSATGRGPTAARSGVRGRATRSGTLSGPTAASSVDKLSLRGGGWATHCTECGRKQRPDERGWRAYLNDDEDEPAEAVVYCPECAAREFAG